MDLLLEALSLALADVDAQLRSEHPDLFVRVDAILAQPDRERTWQGPDVGPTDIRRRRECAWCGETFFVYRARHRGEFCAAQCGRAFRCWQAKRSAA